MHERPHISIILRNNARFSRSVYQGISAYLMDNAPHYDLSMVLSGNIPGLKDAGEGIIGLASDAADVRALRRYNVPVVNISSYLKSTGFSSVVVDNEMGGRLAAEHLLSRKFDNFAYYGEEKAHFAVLRARGFGQTLKAAGFEFARHFHPMIILQTVDPLRQQYMIQKWLATIPKPVGIFCGDDRDAWNLAQACDVLQLNIGKEVGIVGYGNDEFYCLNRHPQLSSVEIRADRVGYEAAALLFRLINKNKVPAKPILIPPSGIVIRPSSNAFITDDSHVLAAIQFMNDHIHEALQIQSVFDHVHLSRDTLERRFRKELGSTVLETIHLLKIDHVKQLLVSSDLTLEKIAHVSGFSSAAYLSTFFREKLGTSPSEYRNRFQCRKR